MEEYNNQYNQVIIKAQTALNNKHNIVICGPGYSGKTYIKNQLIDYLLIKAKN